MGWLTIAWWRWRLAQAFSRNPLVRISDRIDVAVMALAVVVSLAAIPVAGAVGTAVHDSHGRVYAAEQQNRHKVAAPANSQGSAAATHDRWHAGDIENPRVAPWALPAKEATGMDFWVDQHGRPVPAPTPPGQAAVDAVVAAIEMWLSVTAAAALLVAVVRGFLRHSRYNGWRRDIDGLIQDGGGRSNHHR